MYFRFLDNAFESGSDDEERGASALVSMDLGVSALASIGSAPAPPPATRSPTPPPTNDESDVSDVDNAWDAINASSSNSSRRSRSPYRADAAACPDGSDLVVANADVAGLAGRDGSDLVVANANVAGLAGRDGSELVVAGADVAGHGGPDLGDASHMPHGYADEEELEPSLGHAAILFGDTGASSSHIDDPELLSWCDPLYPGNAWPVRRRAAEMLLDWNTRHYGDGGWRVRVSIATTPVRRAICADVLQSMDFYGICKAWPDTTFQADGWPSAEESSAFFCDTTRPQQVSQSCVGFYIGISKDIINRWNAHHYNGYSCMWVIHVARDSADSARCETLILSRVRRLSACENESDGGDQTKIKTQIV
jgi:hypothetical protein